MKHLAGFALFVAGLVMPLVAHAQELHPCTPVAAGLRCAQPLAGPWGDLDFGAPKPVVDFRLDGHRSEPRWRDVRPLAAHGHAHAPLWDAMRALDAPNQAGCATVTANAHSGEHWFAPALPPLPAVQPVQPIAHGHRLMPALPSAPVSPVASCR